MKTFYRYIILLFTLMSIAINSKCLADSYSSAEDASRHLITALKSGNENELLSIMDSSTRNEAENKFMQLRSLISTMHIDSLRVLEFKEMWFNGNESDYYLYDAPSDTGWILVTINLVKSNDNYQVKNFNINLLSQEQYHSNDFSFEHKSPLHFIFLLYSLAVLLLTIFTIVLCIRSKFKRKWLWIVGMIISLPTITFNWSTGEFGLELFKFTLLGFGFSRYPIIAPWIIQSTIPIVLLIFLYNWFKSKNNKDAVAP
jgi:hypothetical protein